MAACCRAAGRPAALGVVGKNTEGMMMIGRRMKFIIAALLVVSMNLPAAKADDLTLLSITRICENCDFSGRNLTRVDFSGTTLRNVSMKNATLIDADFSESELYFVDFSEANAQRSNFSDASEDVDFIISMKDSIGLKLFLVVP